jgi:hypothetical protein
MSELRIRLAHAWKPFRAASRTARVLVFVGVAITLSFILMATVGAELYTYDGVQYREVHEDHTSPQLERLAPWGHRAIFHVGARIFSEGGKADRFWLVREGQVALQTYVPGRGNVTIETLGSGAVLGWSWLFEPHRWMFDAHAIEDAFQAKMNGCAGEPKYSRAKRHTSGRAADGENRIDASASATKSTDGNDATTRPAHVVSKARRVRDKHHLAFVCGQPCVVCGRVPSDAHHIRFAQLSALGRKVSDEFSVPLCRTHHRELHRRGDERAWWKGVKIDPLDVARKLWEVTRDSQNATCAEST